jgi:hypothetical protein
LQHTYNRQYFNAGQDGVEPYIRIGMPQEGEKAVRRPFEGGGVGVHDVVFVGAEYMYQFAQAPH